MTAEQIASIAERTKRYTLFEWGTQDVDPFVVERGEGAHVFGADGTRYIDFNSVSVSVNIGHGDPRVADAIAAQLRKIEFASPYWATEVRAEVGEKLNALTPDGLEKAFFTLAGADANEAAIRTARLVTGRRKILVRRRSYHGATMGVLPLAGDPRRYAVEGGSGTSRGSPTRTTTAASWTASPSRSSASTCWPRPRRSSSSRARTRSRR